MASTYRKTIKGQAEIATRENKLTPRLRSALIMVDGKRSKADLRPLLMPTPDETLAALLAQGFIEVTGAGVASAADLPQATPAVAAPLLQPAPPAPPTGNTPPAMKPMPVPLPVRQRDAVRLLTEQVGPMAEAVAIRMERALSADELRAAVLQGGRIIANIRGQKAAEAYLACFADL